MAPFEVDEGAPPLRQSQMHLSAAAEKSYSTSAKNDHTRIAQRIDVWSPGVDEVGGRTLTVATLPLDPRPITGPKSRAR